MSDERDLDRAAVAALLGVEPDTITNYLNQSREGGRFAGHPFPAPDFKAGRSPVWRAERRAELIAWAQARPGRGAGGGQPAHRRRSA